MDQSKLTGLDSFEVAETVIRSLRTKNTSLRRELQFGLIPPNQICSKDLNEMIEKGVHQKQREDQKLKQINEAIERFEPTPLSGTSTGSSAAAALKDMNNNRNKAFTSKQQHNNDSDDDFDSDDDDLPGKVSSAKGGGRKLRQALQHSKNFANDCDFDATDNNKHIHTPKNPLDDMDSDFDDADDEDMKAIFKDFVAPSSNNKLRSSTQSLSSASSKSSTTATKKGNMDILNSTSKMGVTIKPGQAIRVKPAGGKRKQDL